MQDIVNGRCGWCGTDELYVRYHDQEWGKLVTDDKTLFEFLVLESSQAGLSWITILKKREGYRKAFCDFDAGQVAQMTDEDVERLMRFEGIVRNRLKIKSTITNAKLFLAVQKEFGSFYNYTLSFFPDGKTYHQYRSLIERHSGIIASVRCHEQGYEKAGIQVFRDNHLLRALTGVRLCERPSSGMYLSPNNRGEISEMPIQLCLYRAFCSFRAAFRFNFLSLLSKSHKCE